MFLNKVILRNLWINKKKGIKYIFSKILIDVNKKIEY